MSSGLNDIIAALQLKGKALWGAASVDVAIVGRDLGAPEGSNARISAYSDGDRARSGEMTATGTHPEEALAALTRAVDAEIERRRNLMNSLD